MEGKTPTIEAIQINSIKEGIEILKYVPIMEGK
jgi:hypothetical protein